MYRLIILTISISCFFSSCETDFQLHADEKEVMIVYAILDQMQDQQYVRINKAFLTEGNALLQAVDADNYNPDNLEVIMYKTKETSWGVNTGINADTVIHEGVVYETLDTIHLDTTIIDKESGLFSDNNLIYTFYQSDMSIYETNSEDPKTYIIRIYNKNTGNLVSSSTQIIAISTQFFVAPAIGSVNTGTAKVGFYNLTDGYATSSFRWKHSNNAVGNNGKTNYEFTLFFHYTETKNSVTTDKTISKIFSVDESYKVENDVVDIGIEGEQFFSFLEDNIKEEPDVSSRSIGRVDFMVTAGDRELDIFMSLNEVSLSVNQERPSYTNINNGLGVFASRLNYQFTDHPDLNSDKGIELADPTIDYIKSNYGALGF